MCPNKQTVAVPVAAAELSISRLGITTGVQIPDHRDPEKNYDADLHFFWVLGHLAYAVKGKLDIAEGDDESSRSNPSE